MTNTVTIYSTDELEKHKTTILSNLAKSVWDIRAIIESENAQEVFRQFKFEKQFDYAVQHYFALQEERMVDVNAKQL